MRRPPPVTLAEMRTLLNILLATICLVPGSLNAESNVITIGETAAKSGWAVNYPKQRKLFFMASRLWLFYSDGQHGVFRSSPDGRSWSEPTKFADGGHFGHRFGCGFDGEYVHYAHCTAALGADVRYARGTPNADGSIDWSPEQIAYDTPPDKNVMYPKILVDSERHPWIAFMELVYQQPNAPPYDALVIASSTNDGTWQTQDGFPFPLVRRKVTPGYPDPVGVSLPNGGTYWIYNRHDGKENCYSGRYWNGAAWNDEELIARPASQYAFFNAIADCETVHLLYGAGDIFYTARTTDAKWSAPEAIATDASGHTALARTAPNHIMATWLNLSDNTVHIRKRSPNGWSEPIAIAHASQGLAGAGINLNTLTESHARLQNAIAFTTGAAPPFAIQIATIPSKSEEDSAPPSSNP